MTRVLSPWPDVTGEYVYLTRDKEARMGYDGPVWIFYPWELDLIKRDRNPRQILYWRGHKGTYLGHESQVDENLVRWEGKEIAKDNAPEEERPLGILSGQRHSEISEQPATLFRG